MTIDDIQTKAIETYNNNMKYLEKEHKSKFDKIKLFELAIELEEVQERYTLEYKNDYFDIYDKKEEKWIYNEDSIKYSENISKNISFESKVNSFKTFYEVSYEDEIAEKSKQLSMLSNIAFGNAPVIDYVNRNMPIKEEMKEMFIYLIFGVGLGLHIPFIDKKINAKLYFIIEPSLEIFRLSLFTTDYASLSKKAGLILSIAEDDEEFRVRFQRLVIKTSAYNHYIKFCMFSNNFDSYIAKIQHSLVSQGHLLYSYNRELLSLSRTYQYAKDNFSFINISKVQNLKVFEYKKIIILAAGPSLHKNLEFIKNNQEKYIIVAIYGTMPYLEKYSIIPDIVTQYDENNDRVMDIFKKVKNPEFFSHTIFLFSSHICKELSKAVNKSNIYMFQALHTVKKNFGYLTSPSVGEITYALIQILGGKDISLLGIDMSLDPDTGKSHHDEYSYDLSNVVSEEKTKENFELRKNKIKIKGNFVDEVETLSLFKSSIEHINLFTKKYKKNGETKIYNLSNGAYFDETIPLRVENIDTSILINIDKKVLKEELVSYFNDISSSGFTSEDLEYNEEKLNDAIRLKEKLDSFYIGKKYSNANSFREVLHKIQEELLNSSYLCRDLQKIILNYTEYNLHYIFYFTNLKNINNPKKHIKQLFRILNTQINRIISEYMLFINVK